MDEFFQVAFICCFRMIPRKHIEEMHVYNHILKFEEAHNPHSQTYQLCILCM